MTLEQYCKLDEKLRKKDSLDEMNKKYLSIRLSSKKECQAMFG